ncbi:hypothetical protein BGW36DRAFT_356371 [Talaromyces proteolyticus]|uniref:BZIP domain-containing protein n=1 Tax=Talaromyces proteolyticus TaxID=1131652 RepID=A0AAD4KXR7_9EURO|nr:uncharacterized protein BGW36DRAFT_356371 [Talaromyces proteolyticus]KAH8702241.1 hypothetical protein BGW36DRAFT_356371 [Talaromyces proteolyticus]
MSSAVSTPSSAASPGAVAPSLAPAMQSQASPAAMSPSPGLCGSVTTKEWVIPPRPKPGRKPATDTPPTKRKAQNRAAQRAFRERRAARVGELEEHVKKIEDDFDIRELDLRNKTVSLSKELEQSQNEVSWWKKRCYSLEQELALERKEIEALRKQNTAAIPDTVPINIRRTNKSKSSDQVVEDSATSHPHAVTEQQDHLAGCGGCSTTHCQCLEDAIQISHLVDKSTPKDDGNGTQEPAVKYDPDQMEIDFTERFAATRAPASADHSATSTPPVERCGFCGDGTACICAEMADAASRQEAPEQNRLAPIQNYSAFTPPPSDGDVREMTLPPITQATNPCANGPGTCTQCQSDPHSTLFCKTLAASRAASGLSGCCGGKGTDGGCCQSRPQPRVSVAVDATPLTLTCADAFTTLSRHPNFSQASDELSSWLPKLHTLPKPREPSLGNGLGASISSRPAMEVEAASVMGVLRYFDRRFASK